jgi:hypothetical protein
MEINNCFVDGDYVPLGDKGTLYQMQNKIYACSCHKSRRETFCSIVDIEGQILDILLYTQLHNWQNSTSSLLQTRS